MWKDDAWSCPSCGGVMQRPGDDWFCGECGFRRPTPSWALSGDHVLDPHGSAWPIHLQLPGRANKANAASSAAVAAVFGVPPQVALERMYQVQAVAGRYDVVQFQGRDLRLLLAKNPAGWLETFSLIDPPPTPVILSVNARSADGTDTSWLWDVDYTGSPVTRSASSATGSWTWRCASRSPTSSSRCARTWTRRSRCRRRAGSRSSPTTPRSRTCAAASATDHDTSGDLK